MRTSARITGVVILTLLAVVGVIWYAVFSEDRAGILRVSFLDVGQGDAVLVTAPSGIQVLIDGGPDAGVLRRIAAVMPWYDRSLDVVIASHPDADHITGLLDVVQRYQVGMFLTSSVHGSTEMWKKLQKEVQSKHIPAITAQRGQILSLGGGAYMEILSPDRAVPHVDTNVGCVVARLVYGTTSFLLPCDAPRSVEEYLVTLDGSNLGSTVLKAGHHGSKTSASLLFVGYTNPQYVVFSRGCANKYGFPSPETVSLFKKFNIQAVDTCEQGTITFVSDGNTVSQK